MIYPLYCGFPQTEMTLQQKRLAVYFTDDRLQPYSILDLALLVDAAEVQAALQSALVHQMHMIVKDRSHFSWFESNTLHLIGGMFGLLTVRVVAPGMPRVNPYVATAAEDRILFHLQGATVRVTRHSLPDSQPLSTLNPHAIPQPRETVALGRDAGGAVYLRAGRDFSEEVPEGPALLIEMRTGRLSDHYWLFNPQGYVPARVVATSPFETYQEVLLSALTNIIGGDQPGEDLSEFMDSRNHFVRWAAMKYHLKHRFETTVIERGLVDEHANVRSALSKLVGL